MRWGVEDARCEYWQGRGLWSLPVSFPLSLSLTPHLFVSLPLFSTSITPPTLPLSHRRPPAARAVHLPVQLTLPLLLNLWISLLYIQYTFCDYTRLVHVTNQYHIKDERTIKSKRRNETMKCKETSESLWWNKMEKMEWREGGYNLQIKQLLRRFAKRAFNQSTQWVCWKVARFNSDALSWNGSFGQTETPSNVSPSSFFSELW